jgi:hypothetical protein
MFRRPAAAELSQGEDTMAPGGTTMARNTSAAAVAVIAAFSSYWHMVHVAQRFGERTEITYALPFSVDGMLVVATIAMAEDKHQHRSVRPIARVAFAAGVCASLGANIAAAQPSIGARIVAAWPALALLLVVEILAGPGSSAAAAHPDTISDPAGKSIDAATTRPPAAAPPASRRHRPPPASADTAAPRRGGGTSPQNTTTLNGTPPPAGTPVMQPAGRRGQPPTPHPPLATAAYHPRARRPTAQTQALAAQIIAEHPHISQTELARTLGISTRRLREVLAP